MVALSKKWEKFSLSEHEGDQYLVQEDEIEEGNFLAASFFTSQVLSMEAIARTFKLLWRTRKGFEVWDMGNHRVLFKFKDPSDVERVLKGSRGPLKRIWWLLNGCQGTQMCKTWFLIGPIFGFRCKSTHW